MTTIARESNSTSLELFDGTVATIRAIELSDAAALQRFHAHLSRSTIYRRFFSFHLELTVAEVDRFVNVDGTDRVALVIAVGSELVAIGRYDRTDDPSVAEVAFVVTDDYQHRGLGAVLLTQLAERAHQVGIVRFCAETLAENRAMLNVFRDSGYPMTATNCCGVVEVTLALSRARPGWRRP